MHQKEVKKNYCKKYMVTDPKKTCIRKISNKKITIP